MSHVYVLTNQHQQFLSKSNEWIDGRESTKLFRTEHKDVAINQMFEANTRDVALRIELLECKLDTKRQPIIPEDALSETPLESAVEAVAEGGEPDEMPQPDPNEAPPEQNPEVDPQPAPEVAPDPQPEVNPEPSPEIQPDQPPESAVHQA
ncbi:hypothetical protein HXX02_11475 [Microbulbifer elongatus]|uniref:Uncharacterized protein n=1 Tax=Microbulbifer elongatus TaxID=86173 RepID=A0ABT1P4X7_9GAMM|nr:hypothetical protein [Microbulbifer elongatus]MCQ3830069.1 hypothetical protein [Microbulbifer elongatus]